MPRRRILAPLRVLVPLDGSKSATAALRHVVSLCERVRAELVAVTVLDDRHRETMDLDLPVGPPASSPRARRTANLRQRLDAYLRDVGRVVEERGIPVTTYVLEGEAETEVLAAASRLECDLVAMAPQTHSDIREQLLGSVTEHVLHRCSVPVLIVRPGGAEFFADNPPSHRAAGVFVVPLDGSESGESSLPAARGLAGVFRRRIHLLMVLRPPDPDAPASERLEAGIVRRDAEQYLAGLVTDLRSEGLEAYSEVAVGDPVSELVERANRSPATALVMSARRRAAGSARLFGSVIDPVIRGTRGTMLVVPR